MIIVPVKNEKSLEQALKTYKFKIYKTKQIQKLQERQEFIKPSIKKRAQKKKAQYRQKNQTSSWSFLLSIFFPNINSVEVKPKDPNANNPITSTNDSSGQRVPCEKTEAIRLTIKLKTQIIPTNLFDDNVVDPEPKRDLKNFVIDPH